jgi:hypothetical protein
MLFVLVAAIGAMLKAQSVVLRNVSWFPGAFLVLGTNLMFLGTVKEAYHTIRHRFDRATSIVPPLILMYILGDRRCIGEGVERDAYID